jgi:outer membrane immunogenic protein
VRRAPIVLIAIASCIAATQVAAAADMPVKAAPVATQYSWTGYYFGANAGYGWGRNNVDYTGDGTNNAGNDVVSRTFDGVSSFASIQRSHTVNSNGGLIGLQAGYNWQIAPAWVAGVEADIQGSGVRGNTSTTGSLGSTLTAQEKLKWFGTLRGRIGYLVNERLLVFGTGGLAYGQTDVNSTFNAGAGGLIVVGATTNITCVGSAVCLYGQDSKTPIGWAAGGGLEWAFLNKTSLKLEYLHLALGDQTIVMVTQAPATGNGTVNAKFHNSFDIVRAGVNVRF